MGWFVMGSPFSWNPPPRLLTAYKGPDRRCNQWRCVRLVELVLVIPDHPVRLYYCVECWKHMRDHLAERHHRVEPDDSALDVLAQRPIRLWIVDGACE